MDNGRWMVVFRKGLEYKVGSMTIMKRRSSLAISIWESSFSTNRCGSSWVELSCSTNYPMYLIHYYYGRISGITKSNWSYC
jgi:hypothetical protein